MSGTRRIAFVTHLRCGYAQRLVRGILRYADEHGPFSIREFYLPRPRFQEAPHPSALAALTAWRPDGIVSALMDEDLRPLRDLVGEALPQVNLYASTPGPQLTVVTGSHRHTIAAAVRHFRQIGVHSPGFLALETGAVAVTVKRSIAECVKAFDPARDLLVHPVDVGIVEDPDASIQPAPKAILSWLAKLVRPAGVFCLQLGGGNYMLRLCRDHGLRVPEDLCVIGMDDSDVCLRSEPSLTSVIPVGEQVGHEGMRMLDRLIRTGESQREVVRVEAVEVSIRRSTGRGVSLCDISAALVFIEKNSCRGISVEDVRAYTQHSSRMTFYKEFRRLTGRSPGEVIRERQLREARQLLATSQLTVAQISTLCGFADGGTFTRMFKTATDKTPSEYRKQICSA